jgi:hypothetical protein
VMHYKTAIIFFYKPYWLLLKNHSTRFAEICYCRQKWGSKTLFRYGELCSVDSFPQNMASQEEIWW